MIKNTQNTKILSGDQEVLNPQTSLKKETTQKINFVQQGEGAKLESDHKIVDSKTIMQSQRAKLQIARNNKKTKSSLSNYARDQEDKVNKIRVQSQPITIEQSKQAKDHIEAQFNNITESSIPRNTSSKHKTSETTTNTKKLKSGFRLSTDSTQKVSIPPRQKFKTYQSEQRYHKPPIQLKKSTEDIRKEVKKWSRERKELEQKRNKLQAIVSKKLQVEDQQNREKQKKRIEEAYRNKHEQILKNIQSIEERKRERIQTMRQSLEKQSRRKLSKLARDEDDQPLYKKMEKKFQNKLLKQQEEMKSKIAERKEQMLKQLEDIKKHEIEYMKNINEKRKTRSVSSLKPSSNRFNIYTSRATDFKQKNMEKQFRRKKFEEKLRSIPVKIDPLKEKEILLIKDKSKNPLKYNYLSSVAALSDEKIYTEFKDFKMDLDSRQIGNEYMKSINKQVAESRVHFSPMLPQSESDQIYGHSRMYKNYMPEVKPLLKKPNRQQKEFNSPTSEIEAIMMQYNTNSQRVAQLQKKSAIYENTAIKGILNFKLDQNYNKIIEQEQQIDENYVKALRMRIAEASLIQ